MLINKDKISPDILEELVVGITKELEHIAPVNARMSQQFEPTEYTGEVLDFEELGLQYTTIYMKNVRRTTMDYISGMWEDMLQLTKIRGNRSNLKGLPSVLLYCKDTETKVEEVINANPLIIDNDTYVSVTCNIEYIQPDNLESTELSVSLNIYLYQK